MTLPHDIAFHFSICSTTVCDGTLPFLSSPSIKENTNKYQKGVARCDHGEILGQKSQFYKVKSLSFEI